jgi:alginate O-acetyltransferase complex protein AlgI
VYADFSGYSDMALGTAHLLGYKLTKNFAMPYLSANIAEFWRRWHMSLSSWLRDYVFIPLGGSRVGKARHSFNLMVTMTLCGLWHGASWTFVLFGALHGLLLIGHTQWRTFCKRRTWLDGLQQSAPGTAVRVLVTFLVVALTFVVFRAPRLSAAGAMLARLARVTPGVGPPVPDPGLWYTLVLVLVCHLVVARGWWNRLALRLPGPVAGLAYAGLLSLALMLTPDLGKAFIYFQF